MAIPVRPVDISALQGGLAQLGQQNARQAAIQRQRREQRHQQQAALAGLALGALTGGLAAPAGMEATLALRGAGAGATILPALRRGDAASAAVGAVGAADAYQSAQQAAGQRAAGDAVQGALQGMRTPTVPMAGATGTEADLAPHLRDRNAAIDALRGAARADPSMAPLALQGALALRTPAPAPYRPVVVPQDAAVQSEPGGPFAVPAPSAPKPGSGFTLGPGQTRYGPNAEVVASVPDRAPDGGVRAQRIDDLIKEWGVQRKDAVDIVDGIKRIEITEAGFARLVNTRTGEVAEIPIRGGGSAPATPAATAPAPAAFAPPASRQAPPATLWEAAGSSAGVVPAAMEYWARIVGQIPGGTVPKEALESADARTMFRLASQDLTRALANNRRFPVTERNAITEMAEMEPSVFDSPIALRTRLRALDQRLASNTEHQNRIANDANQPTDVRADAKSSVEEMRNFRALIGVPGGQGIPEPPPPSGTAMATETVPPPGKREVGKTYMTPAGPAIWRGTGWERIEGR